MVDEPALRAVAAHYRALYTPHELHCRLGDAHQRVRVLLDSVRLQEAQVLLGATPVGNSQGAIDAVAREVRALLWALS